MLFKEFCLLDVDNHWGDDFRIKAVRKYWVIAVFDWWSTDDYHGLTLYATVGHGASYDWEDETLVFESYLAARAEAQRRTERGGSEWFPINIADSCRRDRALCLGKDFRQYKDLMEFKASQRAFSVKEHNSLSRVPQLS